MADPDGRGSYSCSVPSLSELHEQQQHTREGDELRSEREDLPSSLEAAADRVQIAVDFVDSLMRHPRDPVPPGRGDADQPPWMQQGEQQGPARGPEWPEREPSEPAGLDLTGVPLEAASLFCLSTDVSLEAMMEQQPPQQHHHHLQQQPEAQMEPQGHHGEAPLPDGCSSKAPSPPKQLNNPSSARRSICSVKEALNRIQSQSLARRRVADKAPWRGANSKGSPNGAGGATEASSDELQEEKSPSLCASRATPPAEDAPDHGGGGAGSSSRAAAPAPPVLEPGPPRTPLDARQQRRRSRSAALGRLKARRSLDVSGSSTPGRPRLSSPSSSRLPLDTPTAREASSAADSPEAAAAAPRPSTEHIERLEALRVEEAGTRGPGYAGTGTGSRSSFSREGSQGRLGAAASRPRHAEEPLIATTAGSTPADRGSQRRLSSGSLSRGPGAGSQGRHDPPAWSHQQQQHPEPRGRSPGGEGSRQDQRRTGGGGGGGDAGALSARLEGLTTEWQQREGERRRQQLLQQQQEEERKRRRQQQQQQWDEEEERTQQQQRMQEDEEERRQQAAEAVG